METRHTEFTAPTTDTPHMMDDRHLTTEPPDTGRLPGLRRLFARRPVASAVGIALADAAVVSLTGAGMQALLPHAGRLPAFAAMNGAGNLPAFAAMAAGIALLVALLAGLGWWKRAGFNRPREWRNLHFYLVPAAALLLFPFIGGGHLLSPGTTALFVVSYALTGFYEEGLNRGVILTVLRPTGTKRAVFISAALFGASHLVNVLFRNPFVVVLQAIGAFTEGIGFAALRLRTNTLWPLVALHLVDDLMLHYGNLPVIPLHAAQTTICMTVGLFLLRGTGRRAKQAPDTGTALVVPAVR
jgi:hypothetical protein